MRCAASTRSAKGNPSKSPLPETKLAIRLIDELSNDAFEPEKYEDEYAQRVLELVKKKAEGEEITVSQTSPQRGNVIDLMEALKKKSRKRTQRKETGDPSQIK